MLGKFLDPKNDVAFRKVFGTEKNQDILIRLLNDVIIFQENRPITKVTFLKTVQAPDIDYKKTSIVDILCEDDLGYKYIVQIKAAGTSGFEKNAECYASKAFCCQIHVGGAYHNLKEVIFLAITDYIMFPEKPEYKSDHIRLDKKTLDPNLKDFSYTFIELPKFTKTANELNTRAEKWCHFFKHEDNFSSEDLKTLLRNDEILERAYRELDRFSWTPQELLYYEQAEKAKNDYLSSLMQSRLEGIAEGKALGASIDLGEAKKEREREREREIYMARKMIQSEFPLEEIAKYTGLTIEEIKNLKL